MRRVPLARLRAIVLMAEAHVDTGAILVRGVEDDCRELRSPHLVLRQDPVRPREVFR